MRRLTLLLTAIAAVFLYWMLSEVGWDTLWRHILQVGWGWPLILIPFGLFNLLSTIAWEQLLPAQPLRPSLSRLFCLRLAGEAFNQLTPTASLGGEPYKAMRLTAAGIPWEDAGASILIQKALTVLSLVLYICLGLVLLPVALPHTTGHLLALSLAALLLGAGGLGFMIAQRRHPCTGALRLLEKLRLCPAALKAKAPQLASLDHTLASFYQHHPRQALIALGLFFLAWIIHGVEVYAIFWLLGSPITWELSLCLDALAMLITSLGFMIPASLGVQEGGNILLALGFHLGAALGAAFSILRRLREAFWLALGLLVAAREK